MKKVTFPLVSRTLKNYCKRNCSHTQMSRQFSISMGKVQSRQCVDHNVSVIFQALPADSQSAVIFQADRSKENKRGNPQLFVESRGSSSQFAINNLGDLNRIGYKQHMPNKSVIPPNALNEKRLENIQNSNSLNNNSSTSRNMKNNKRKKSRQMLQPQVANGAIDNSADGLQQQNHHGSNNNSSRSWNMKNYKRKKLRQTLQPQVANGAIDNSADGLQQQNHYGWNQVPVMNWSQPDSERRSSSFQNSLRYRFETYNNRNENGRRFQNVTPNEGLNSLSNLFHLNFTTEVAPSYENFKSFDLPLKNSEKRVSDVINIKNSNSTVSKAFDKKDDDIEYLFTVDPSSKYRMVVEVDLQSDRINIIPNSKAANLIQNSKADDVPANNSVMAENSTVPPKSRKRKLSNNDKRDNKRPNQPKCTICKICYDDVIKRQQQMLFSNCNHTFCLPCITKKGASKICPACGDKFLTFRRLFCD